MRELVLYPSEGRTRWVYAGAGCWGFVVLLGLVGAFKLSGSDWTKLVIAGLVLPLVLWSVRRHEANPLPRLRLSEEGLEGEFGLLRWSDVAEVETAIDWSLYSRGRDVVVRLRPGAAVFPATREFASGPMLYDDATIQGTTLKIMRGSLAPSATELVAEIRAYHERYAGET